MPYPRAGLIGPRFEPALNPPVHPSWRLVATAVTSPGGRNQPVCRNLRGIGPRTPSLTVKCSPRLTRQHEVPICRDFLDRKADARTRTADPFITRVDQVSSQDARSRAKPHESTRTRAAEVAAEDLRRQRRRPCVDPYRTAALFLLGAPARCGRPASLRAGGPEPASDEASSDLLTGAAGRQSTCRRRRSTSVEPRTAGRPRCHSPPRLAPQPGWEAIRSR